MFFTIEDYKKIQEWLSRNSIKDTEFNEAMQPFKGNEIISFVQNGHNTKAYLKDFVDQLFLLGIPDFVNITEKFDESNISLSRAIQLIPYKSRKIGQVITFLNEEGVWKIYQFKGKRKNQWNEESLWIDLIKDIASKITTLADEEDITTVEENGATVFKFKDKVYNPDNFSGKGRVYLRKNIVTVKDYETGNTYKTNLLTQEMIGKENTIYIIQYDYNLNGQTITIPEGCVLQFEGGSIRNGNFYSRETILLNATIFSFINISIYNKIYSKVIYPEWYGAKCNGIDDDGEAIKKALLNQQDVILQDNSVYYLKNYNETYTISNCKLYSVLGSKIKYIKNNDVIKYGRPMIVFSGNNFTIDNITFDGNVDYYARPLVESGKEWQEYLNIRNTAIGGARITNSSNFKITNSKFLHCLNALYVRNSNNFDIDDCTFSYTIADSLYVTDGSYNGIITNCFAFDNGDDTYCVNVNDANYDAPSNITFINCRGKNLRGSLCEVYGGRDVTFINCVGNMLRACGVRVEKVREDIYNDTLGNINIIGCHFIHDSRNVPLSSNGSPNTKDKHNINIIGCKFESSLQDGTVIMPYNLNRIKISGSYLVNISLDIYHVNDFTLSDCIVDMPNNSTIEYCNNISIINNIINNTSIVLDRIREHRGEEDSSYIRCFNIKDSGNIRFLGNYYKFKENTIENSNKFALTIDDYSKAINDSYIEVDTANIYVRNNNDYNIIYSHFLDNVNTKIHDNNKNSIKDNTFYYDDTEKNNLKIFRGNSLYKCRIIPDNFKYGASNNEIPKIPNGEENLYVGLIYMDRSIGCPRIYTGNNWVTLKVTPTYSAGNNIYAGGSESRPNLINTDDGYNYYDITLNTPIWWNGERWLDALGNNADALKSGTFANKPTKVNAGYAYFCTDKQTEEGTTNGIMIYYKGSNTWVDALGRVVS